MAEGDKNRIELTDVATALVLLTRLPVPLATDHDRSAQAAWAYPVVGGLLGLLAGLVVAILAALNLPSFAAAGLGVATLILLTGAMHEDGLGDSADGLWGGNDKARRLEIMRDSRIGSYGVLALVISVVLRIAALGTLVSAGYGLAGLVAAAALSRAAMVHVMADLPHARDDGLSVVTGRPARETAWLAAAAAVLIALVFTGGAAILAALVTALVALGFARIARARIGGQTGDILGATQQLCEIAALLSIAAVLG